MRKSDGVVRSKTSLPQGVPRQETPTREQSDETSVAPSHRRRPQKRLVRGWLLLAGGVVSFLLLLVLAAHGMHRAWVSIAAEAQKLELRIPLQEAMAEEGGGVPLLRSVTFQVRRSTIVRAEGSRYREAPAEGVVEIRNYWSRTPLSLVPHTRFEAPNGIVFRTQEAIRVPGFREVDGTLLPGTTTARVVADTSGDDGNIQKGTPLLLPAFRGMPQYERVSAVAVRDFSGGWKGEEPIIPRVEQDRVLRQFLREISAQAFHLSEAVAALPEGYAFVAASPTVRPVAQRGVFLSGGAAQLEVVFRVQAYAFNTEQVKERLLRAATGNLLGFRIRVDEAKQTVVLDGFFQPRVAVGQLKQAIAGKDRDGVVRILMDRISLVQEVNLQIFPFWRHTFPVSPDRIALRIDYRLPDGVDRNPQIR